MDSIIFKAIQDIFLPYLGGAGQPALRLWIVLGIGLVTGTMVLGWVGSLLSGGSLSRIMAFISMVLGVVLIVLGVALASLYIVPKLNSAYSLYVLIGVALFVFLVLVVPMIGKMNGFNYLVALGTSFAAILAAVLLMYLAGIVYDMIAQGSSNVKTRRTRKQSTDRVLGN